MKKIILLAVVLLSSIFYVTATSFDVSGVFNGDGYIFVDNSIQEGVYSGTGDVSKPVEVKDGDTIYERWGSNYIGESSKQKINVVYPMIINDGTAIKFLNSSNDVIDEYFDEYEGYEGLIITNGEAYNSSAEKADNHNYLFTRLVNNLYINNQKMKIATIGNKYSIQLNSFIYFTPGAIYYYKYSYGTMKFDKIEDMTSDSVITIGNKQLTYQDLLILLGEEKEVDGESQSRVITVDEDDELMQQHNTISTNPITNGTNANTNGSSGSGIVNANGTNATSAPAPEKTKHAKEAESADVPTGSTTAAGQIATDQTVDDERPFNTEWVMPKVDASKFTKTANTTTYTLSFNLTVDDPASVILNNSLTFDIYYDNDELPNYGSTYKRYSTRISNGDNTIRVTGLKSSTEFAIKGYFQYKNKYGATVKTPVVFLEKQHFETKDVGDLGNIICDFGDLNANVLYSNRIVLSYFSFSNASSYDAISSVSNVMMTLTNGNDSKICKMPNESIEQLKNGGVVSFGSSSNLKAGSTYTGTITCYDEFNNLLTVTSNTFTLNTCKTPPSVKLTLNKPTLESISFKAEISNPDSVDYSNLKVVIKDANGNKVQFGEDSFLAIEPGITYDVDDLGINKNYTINVYADCDINDNKGKSEHNLLTKAFVTGNISNLGSVYLNVKNLSDTYLIGNDKIDTSNRAILSIKLNTASTKKELINYVDLLTVVLTDGNNTISYSLKESELASLLASETLILDTDQMSDYGLLSNSEYNLSFLAYYTSTGDNISINVSSSLSRIKTTKKPMKVEFKSLDSYQGFITSNFRVVDDDNISKNSNLILRVIKKQTDGKEKIIGSFNIPKGDYYDLAMFSDASYSSDGKAYNIEGNTDYILRFITEEAYLDDDYKINYTFFEQAIRTEAGVSANIYLNGLNEYVDAAKMNTLPSEYTQLAYLESTGTQWIDTQCKLSNDSRVEARFICYSGGSAFGIMQSGYTHSHYYNNFYNGSSGWGSKFQNNVDTVFESESKSDKSVVYTINGVTTTTTYSGNVDSTNNYKIFASGNNGGNMSASRIYYLRMYNRGTIVRNFVPARRESDSVVGMYDLVEGKFYTDVKGGNFVAGPNVYSFDNDSIYDLYSNVNLLSSGELTYTLNDYSKYQNNQVDLEIKKTINDEYYLLDYLQSTGSQWIDTQCTLSNDSKVETRFICYSGASAFGVMQSGYTQAHYYNNYYNGSSGWGSKFQNNVDTTFVSESKSDKSIVYKVNGVTTNVKYSGNVDSVHSYKLFASGDNGGNRSNSRIYYFKMYDQGVLVRDYVPVQRISDGELGFYDLVNNQFYPNNGTGKFQYGRVLYENEIDDNLYSRIDYIQSDGNQYINTGYYSTENTKVVTYGFNDGTGDQYYYGNDAFTFDNSSIGSIGYFKNETYLLDAMSPLMLFAKESSGNIITTPTRTTIYWLRIFENGIIVHDYVPVRRKTDNVVGLYDCVSKNFYPSKNDSQFIGSVRAFSDYNYIYPGRDADKMYDASLTIKINDNRVVNTSQNIYVDVFRVKNGNKTLLSTEKSTLFTYSGSEATIDFDLSVFIDDNINNSYYLEVYTLLGNGSVTVKLPLDTLSFSTEEKIYTINSIEEFFAIGSSTRKYVVTKDLSFEANYLGKDDTTNQNTMDGIHWRSSYFNARVDFQGFKMTLTGTGPLIYRTNKVAKISNVVFENNVKNANSTSELWGIGTLVYYNYGTISNIYMEYSEVDEIPYLYASYYTTEPDDVNVKHYKYQRGGGICGENYGVVENFVINALTDYTCARRSGLVAMLNVSGSVIRNGYVYSSVNKDNKAQVNIYSDGNEYFGAITGYNYSGATIENVYALADVNLVAYSANHSYTGIIAGIQYGAVRNCYAVGSTAYNVGSLSKFIASPTTYGPVVGYTSTSYKNENIFYISDLDYSSTNSSNYNKIASVMSLRNASWQNSILGSGSFNIDDLVASSCYPQVRYSSDVMPIQDMISFPELTSYSMIDLTFSYTYKMGSNDIADRIFNNYLNDNKTLFDSTRFTNNILYDEADSFGYSSGFQPVVLLFSDRNSLRVKSINVGNIKLNVIDSIADGKGMTTVYAIAYNPTYAYSKYRVTDVTFTTGEEDEKVQLNAGRYLYVEFYKSISTVDKWVEMLHNGVDATLSQNYILLDNIDFNNEYTLQDVFVTGTYSGYFNGNNKTISNIKYCSVDKDVAGGLNANMGLFKTINGNVYDLNIESLYFEGGSNAGLLAGQSNGGTFTNIHISNSYCAGLNSVGGLFGYSSGATKIVNSSISNVKLIATGGVIDSSHFDSYVGGAIGYIEGILDISNSFVQDIYIEDWNNMILSTAGGLIGRMRGSGSNITNCYTSGTIIGSVDSMGGLIGLTQVVTNVTNCYANVDLITYNGNAGGLIGRALDYELNVNRSLAFGSIVYGNLMNSDDIRLEANSFVCMDTTRLYYGAYYYESSTLNGKTLNGNVVANVPASSKNMTFDSFDNDSFDSYLDLTTYYTDNNDYLPMLYDTNGIMFDNQNRELISNNSLLKFRSARYEPITNMLTVVVAHTDKVIPNSIEIMTDFTYVEENTGTNYNGISSYSAQKSFDFDQNDVVVNTTFEISSGMYVTTLTYPDCSILRSYDTYLLTGIKFKCNGTDCYLRVNRIIEGLYERYKQIASGGQWQETFKNKSVAENIEILTDIDLSNLDIVSNAQNGANVIINRLITNNAKTSNSYLDISNAVYDGYKTFPYSVIQNLSLNDSYFSNSINWIYDGSISLIRNCITEMANVSFSNITTFSNYCSGLVNYGMGDIHDITVTNCDIEARNPSIGATGIFDYSNALFSNVYVGFVDVVSSYNDTGVLIGNARTNKRHVGINNVTIDESKASGKSYVGTVAGSIYNNGQNYYDGVSITLSNEDVSYKVENCNISNVSITSTGDSGGITGAAQFSIYFRNNNISNSYIIGTTSAGGIAGWCYGNPTKFDNNVVYASTVKSVSNAGGISGRLGWLTKNLVDNCIIVATDSNAGGLWGTSINGWVDKTDQASASDLEYAGFVENTKVYGNTNVGGLAGTSSYHVDAIGYVDNCEIYGNSNVGGAVGYIGVYWISNPYVYNTLIAPLDDSIYGITKASSQAYFGGLIGYGGRAFGFVDKCIIGGSNANFVGGLQGRINYKDGSSVQSNSICRDSIVIGNNYVGGLYGSAMTISDSSGANYKLVATGNYSNATVIGNDRVAGICGQVSAYRYTYKDQDNNDAENMVNMPYIEYSYFTGTIQAKETASAIFGEVIGNTANLTINGLVSMPNSVSGKNVEAVFADGDINSNVFYYNWSNLLNEDTYLKISLWANTQIDMSSDTSITNMAELLQKDKYASHVGTMSEVETDYTAGHKEGRKFIYAYSNVSSDPYDNGYSYELEDLPGKPYTQLDYIESTGTQWIDTQCKLSNDSRVEARFICYSGVSAFGVMQSGYTHSHYYNNYYNGSSGWGSKFQYNVDTVFESESKSDNTVVFSINGNVTSTTFGGNVDSNNNYKIFASGNNGAYLSTSRIYYLRMYDNGVLVRNYIPVKRNIDDQIGLYDLVEGKFYTDVKGGNFVAGPVSEKPNAYLNNISYIANNIAKFSLSGYKTNDLNRRFYYTNSMVNRYLMPFTVSGGMKLWETNDSNFITNSSIVNTMIGKQYTLTMSQGVYIPGTNAYNDELSEKTRLLNSYKNFKDGLTDKIEFEINNERTPQDDIISGDFDIYASSVNTFNIDFRGDFDGYTELEFIESNNNQYIDTGTQLSNESKIETRFICYSGASAFGVMQSGYTQAHYYNNFYMGSSGWGSKFKYNLDTTLVSESDSNRNITYTINGVSTTAKFGGNSDASNNYKLFASGNNGGNASTSRIYYFKMYDKGVLVRDYIPARRNSDGVVGMFDLVEFKFYQNAKTGNFIAGPEAATNRLADIIKVSVSKDTEGDVLTKQTLNKSTYTLNCDYSTDLTLRIYTKSGIDTEDVVEYDISVNDLTLKALSYDDNGYYINPNNNLVFDASTNDLVSTLNDELVYLNIYNRYVYLDGNDDMQIKYGTYVLDSKGNIYDVDDGSKVNTITVSDSSYDESLPLYKFSYSNDYYTYGTYTYIDYKNGMDSTISNRFYYPNNELRLIKSNSSATYNDYFIYKNGDKLYETYLRKDGTLISIGNVDILDSYLQGFTNSGIKHISTNLDDTSPVLIVTYYNGTICGYDVTVEGNNRLFSTTKLLSGGFGSFFANAFNSLFNFGGSSDNSDNREVADNVVSLMTSNSLSLNQIVSGIDEENIDDAIVEDEGTFALAPKFSMMLKNMFASSNSESSSVDKKEDGSFTLHNNVEGELVIDGDSSELLLDSNYSLKPLIAGVTDGTNKTVDIGEKLISIDNAENKYVVAYDEEKQQYDIYSIEELLENPEEPISENDKVIDMASLKSLYNALGQEDRNESRGITLYVLVAVAISSLMGIFVVLNKIKRN